MYRVQSGSKSYTNRAQTLHLDKHAQKKQQLGTQTEQNKKEGTRQIKQRLAQRGNNVTTPHLSVSRRGIASKEYRPEVDTLKHEDVAKSNKQNTKENKKKGPRKKWSKKHAKTALK